MTGWL
jgi:phosphatidylserine decarboxylase